jgi:hypothetical protein
MLDINISPTVLKILSDKSAMAIVGFGFAA